MVTQNTNSNNNNRIPLMPTTKTKSSTLDRNKQRDSRDKNSSNFIKAVNVKKAADIFNSKANTNSVNHDAKRK